MLQDTRLEGHQESFVQQIWQQVQAYTAILDALPDRSRPHCLAWLGGGGTGKCVTVQWTKESRSVTILCPPGRQVSRYRLLFPECTVDALYGALYGALGLARQPPSTVAGHELMVIKEVGQVSRETFAEVMELCLAKKLKTRKAQECTQQ